jgi:hypothetical protein
MLADTPALRCRHYAAIDAAFIFATFSLLMPYY